jgi:hypothetical protein
MNAEDNSTILSGDLWWLFPLVVFQAGEDRFFGG